MNKIYIYRVFEERNFDEKIPLWRDCNHVTYFKLSSLGKFTAEEKKTDMSSLYICTVHQYTFLQLAHVQMFNDEI